MGLLRGIWNLFCYLLPMKRLLSSQKTYWKLHLYLYSYQECVFWLLRVVGQLPCDAVPDKTYLLFMQTKWMRSTIMWKPLRQKCWQKPTFLSKRKLWFYITKNILKISENQTNLYTWFHDIEKWFKKNWHVNLWQIIHIILHQKYQRTRTQTWEIQQ